MMDAEITWSICLTSEKHNLLIVAWSLAGGGSLAAIIIGI